MAMPYAALTHNEATEFLPAERFVCLPSSRFQVVTERRNLADHIFTAPGKRNPKIPTGAWEKYVSQLTVTAERTTAGSGQKG